MGEKRCCLLMAQFFSCVFFFLISLQSHNCLFPFVFGSVAVFCFVFKTILCTTATMSLVSELPASVSMESNMLGVL